MPGFFRTLAFLTAFLLPVAGRAACVPSSATTGMIGCEPQATSMANTDWVQIWIPGSFPAAAQIITVTNLLSNRTISNPAITGGTINNTVIGNTGITTGAFTTLSTTAMSGPAITALPSTSVSQLYGGTTTLGIAQPVTVGSGLSLIGGVLAASGSGGTITALTGDVLASGTGSVTATVVKVNGVAYGTSPSTNTVPIVTSSNTVTYELVPNTALLNAGMTIGGQSVALGGVTINQGTGGKIQLSTGTTSTDDCAKFDASGNVVDAGVGCGSGSGSVTNVATSGGLTGGPITTTGTITCIDAASTVKGCPTPDGTATHYLNGSGGWTTPPGTGTVSNVATGSGLSGGPITTTGTVQCIDAASTVKGCPTPDGNSAHYLNGGGSWTTPAGAGTVTSVATSGGLSGGTITTSGTLSCVDAASTVKGCPTPDGTSTHYLNGSGGWTTPPGSGTVTSITLATPSGTLSLGGTNPVTTSGTINADINLSHANTWAAVQTFTNSDIKLLGSSTGATTFTSANAGASNFTVTIPANTGTVAELNLAQTWTAAQTVTNSDLILLGSSTGATTFTSANAGASNYTITLPANTGTIAELNLAQTWTAAQTFTNSDLILLGSSTGATTFTSANAGASNFTLTVPGRTATIGTTTGTLTSGNCVKFDASGNSIDAGAPCGTSTASGANPTGTAGPTAVNGSASTFLRSDGAPAVQKASSSQFGIVEVDNQTIIATAGVISVTAPNRTVTSCGSCTILATDMGGQVNYNGTSLTATVPAISSTVFAAGMTGMVVNQNATSLTVSSTPALNGIVTTGAGPFVAVLPPNGGLFCTSNGVSLDCAVTGWASSPTVYAIGTVSSGTTTIDCRNGNLQSLTNGGAFTLALTTTVVGNCTLHITNNGSAGTITLSGFSEGSNTGDALTTTNADEFDIVLTKISSKTHYLVSAYQ